MMGRSKVQSIYSILNARNELLKAVKSAPFFGTYLSWNDLESHLSDNDLFKIGQNAGFARLSGYVDGDNSIDLDWNDTKQWLFGDNGNLGNVNLLKSLVRTQVYRPLFFKHNDYENFTRNQSRYWCKTRKTFLDHEGNEHVLVWDNNTFGTVDIQGSGLLSKYQDGSIDLNSVQYSTQANTIQYKVVSEPIQVLGDKFIYNDMEFFVTRKSTETGIRQVKSLYFNEFQEAMETQASKVKIDDSGEFAIGFNHIGYGGDKAYGEVHLKISEDGTLLEVVSPEDAFEGTTKYRQEIVDNLFNIDGVWYRLIKDNNGRWSGIEYAYVEESLLRQIPVSSDGVAQFSRWGLTFKLNYSEGDTNVQVIKDVSVDVKDTVLKEWCSFDDGNVEIDGNKTFEWNLATEILRLSREFPATSNLGGGVLYDGDLLDGADFTLSAIHQLNDGYVETIGVLSKKSKDGVVLSTTQIGTLFDVKMELAQGKTFFGNIATNYEIVDGYENIFVTVGNNLPRNVLNAVWTSKETWDGFCSVEKNVGTMVDNNQPEEVDVQDEEGDADGGQGSVEAQQVAEQQQYEMVAQFDGDLSSTYLSVSPQYGSGTNITGYLVKTSPKDIGYSVVPVDGKIHVVVEGRRFSIDLTQKTIDYLRFDEMPVNLLDFSTTYLPEKLRDNLLDNTRQAMLAQIVDAIMSAEDGERKQMSISTPGLNCYLDMFSDLVSLENFVLVGGIQQDSNEAKKFQEVFKNSVHPGDESLLGVCWEYLNEKISDTFSGNSSILLNGEPSISTTREDNGQDIFTLRAIVDLSISQNKELVRHLSLSDESWKDKWIVGNATIHEVPLVVEFTPFFDGASNSLKIDARCHVEKSKESGYGVSIEGIVYNLDGQVRTRQLDNPIVLENVNLDDVFENQSQGRIGNLDDIQGWNPIDKIEDVFGSAVEKEIVVKLTEISDLPAIPVSTTTLKNPTYRDGEIVMTSGEPWELQVGIPEQVVNRDPVVKHGRTMFNGEVFDVSTDDSKVVSIVDPTKTMDIHKVKVGEEGNDYTFVVVDGKEPIVSKNYMTSHFNLHRDEVSKSTYLQYIQGYEKLLEEVSTSGDISFANFENMAAYCDGIYDKLEDGTVKTATWDDTAKKMTFTLTKDETSTSCSATEVNCAVFKEVDDDEKDPSREPVYVDDEATEGSGIVVGPDLQDNSEFAVKIMVAQKTI